VPKQPLPLLPRRRRRGRKKKKKSRTMIFSIPRT
jgi:hypothetical protein